ncbi:MAG: membrane dipeptidase [Gemmatimonadetes bacterium]|nr:membrane dipeptidase [Gemmatimonadota bacterium]
MKTFLVLAGFTVLAAPLAAQVPDSAFIRRALRLHREVPMVDTHNDHPWEMRDQRVMAFDAHDMTGPLPSFHTDVLRLRAGGVGAQFWSIFLYDSMIHQGAIRVTMEQLDIVKRMEARYPDVFAPARTADDIVRAHRQGKIASLMGIEGGHAIENSLGALRLFYDLGVRYMTLTWNNDVPWADANIGAHLHNGLTPFGYEVVREMNRLGMLVDLSHVSDSVMAQVLRTSAAPVIFSHSSARALADHPRNVPDWILRGLPQNGGVVMVNFNCGFVDSAMAAQSGARRRAQAQLRVQFGGDSVGYRTALAAWDAAHPASAARPTIAQVADHIDHIRRVAGVDHVGYGSDFDGISCTPRGLEDVSTFPRLTGELLRRGYSDDDVKKVIGLNLLRAMRQAEAVAARLQRERPPSTATLAGLDSVGVGR